MNWKVIAIVFIILFVIETLIFVSSYSAGSRLINNRNYCINTCDVKKAYSFSFDSPTGRCTCFDSAANEIYSEVIR